MSTISSARVLGEREEQEDRYCMHPFRMPDLEGYLLAVFDGHGGAETAQHCRTMFPHYFTPRDANDVSSALTRTIARLAHDVRAHQSGTIVSAACILESHDIAAIAVLGDSPVVARRTDGSFWMSKPHNVRDNNTPEVNVIESPTAVIITTDGIFNEESEDETLRRLGSLATTDGADANALLMWRMQEGGVLEDNVTVLLWKK